MARTLRTFRMKNAATDYNELILVLSVTAVEAILLVVRPCNNAFQHHAEIPVVTTRLPFNAHFASAHR
jgi:hypothetical protein